jgi:hypothetical protein
MRHLPGEYANLASVDGRYGLIDGPEDVGGWPTLTTATPPADTDGDGIPDDEEPPGRDPHWKHDSRNAQLHDEDDGHTNLERYLNRLVLELKPELQ